MQETTIAPTLESLRQLAFSAIVGTDERIPETQDGVCDEMPEQTETPKMIVVESPLAGDTERNKRFAAWCCRAVWEVERVVAIASHLICPQYLDDRVPEERAAGMALKVCWIGDTHWLFVDLGQSEGMDGAGEHCYVEGIPITGGIRLRDYHPPSWEAFLRGEWPPCTPGFGPSEIDQIFQRLNEDEQTVLMSFASELLHGRPGQ